MAKQWIIVVLAGALLTLPGGCGLSRPSPHVSADLGSPKAAALTFLRAISAGDVETAKSASVGTKEEVAAVEAFSTLITGLREYDKALTSHFSTEAVQTDTQIRQAITDLLEISIGHAENAIVNEGPERASVEPAAGGIRLKARPPIYLRKEKDGWKVDLEATSQVDHRFSPATAEQFSTAGKALHQAARQVNAGRYKSLAEAQKDTDAAVP